MRTPKGIELPLLICDRCGATHRNAWVDDTYLVDTPTRYASALCPRCAAAEDPHHRPGSWRLRWDCEPPTGRPVRRP